MPRQMRIPEDYEWPTGPEVDLEAVDALRFPPPTYHPGDQDEDQTESRD